MLGVGVVSYLHLTDPDKHHNVVQHIKTPQKQQPNGNTKQTNNTSNTVLTSTESSTFSPIVHSVQSSVKNQFAKPYGSICHTDNYLGSSSIVNNVISNPHPHTDSLYPSLVESSNQSTIQLNPESYETLKWIGRKIGKSQRLVKECAVS